MSEGRRAKRADEKRGIGFYSYNQIKNDTTAGRIGAMLIGGIYVTAGVFIILRLIIVRRAESHIWGSSESHTVGFVFGICLIGIGAFAMHVEVISFWRKLCRWVFETHQHSIHRRS